VVTSLCRPALSDEAFVAPATAREIAADLVVTEAAVKQHLLRLYQKFRIPEGANRRVRLANEVVALGMVRPLPLAEKKLPLPERKLPPAEKTVPPAERPGLAARADGPVRADGSQRSPGPRRAVRTPASPSPSVPAPASPPPAPPAVAAAMLSPPTGPPA
jgi:hypothetical protein